MAKDFSTMEDSNTSLNPTIHDVSLPSRRVFLRGGVAAAAAGLFAPMALTGCASTPATSANPAALGRSIGFKSVPMAALDTVTVPEGYTARVLYRWGDAVGIAGQMPAFKTDGSNTAAEQNLQAGMHHDGMAFFALDGSQRGLLAMNHEYVDDGLLHTDGTANWSAAKVKKSMAAHGVSVIEVERSSGGWKQVLPSKYARRITAETPMLLSGPVAGHAMVKTAADPTGTRVLGTFNNCANGQTPWGTYLTCEENFANYFEGPANPDAHQKRWGIKKGGAAAYRWNEFEERFDANKHPNEANRFGWVVEIDPMDPTSTPIKRTALGRAAHEGAATAVTDAGRAVVYMGEDSRFEYIYKFVSRDAVKPGGFAANRELLDHGTLYVARFDADGTGEWLPLTQGKGPLTTDKGFTNQGDVLIKARQASDLLGATKMDRPEWGAVNPDNGEVYFTLTNNSSRTVADAANPRAANPYGHIIRWREDRRDHAGKRFNWDIFLLAGPQGDSRGPNGAALNDASILASPDGLWFDPDGRLWIQTDMSGSQLASGPFGHNQMLVADPRSGEVKRFLTGPIGSEVTGISATPDFRTLFVNIQHPGEGSTATNLLSSWPDGPGRRPRSATVVITREDGKRLM